MSPKVSATAWQECVIFERVRIEFKSGQMAKGNGGWEAERGECLAEAIADAIIRTIESWPKPGAGGPGGGGLKKVLYSTF